MLIGALHGRTAPYEDETHCFELVDKYRERFIWELGATRCRDLRESGYGSEEMPCAQIIERGTRVLLKFLDKWGSNSAQV